MIAAQDAVAQLDALLGEFDDLSGQPDAPARAKVLVSRLQAAIERLSLPASSYVTQANQYRGYDTRHRIPELIAIATALRDDLQAGWFASIVELVRADTYNDFLEMAEGLLNAGYKDAAGVIAGSSLEVHLRSLCGKHGIATQVGGKPMKADTMNAELKKAGVYSALEQKNVTAWLHLRNAAAHANYNDYDAKDVAQLITSIRTFSAKYPA